MNDSMKEYLSKEFKIDVTNIRTKDNISIGFLDGIVNELLAKNNDNSDASDPHSQAALAITKLRQDKSSIIKKITQNGQKKLFNDAAVNYFSKDYSNNTNIKEFINILNNQSVKRVVFEPIKNDKNIRNSHHSNHLYSLNRNRLNNSIELYFNDKTYVPFLSIEFKDKNTPEFKPLADIKSNIKAFNIEWPYPINKELDFNYANDARLGATIARYLPSIDWYKVDLRKGAFGTDVWTVILSTLNNIKIIDTNLGIYENFRKKGLKSIEYGLEAPVGEFTLIIDNKNERKNPDIELKYVFENKTASLKIEMASMYNKNSDSGIMMDKYAF